VPASGPGLLRHFVSNGGGHNEPKFGIHRAGLCRSSRFHRIKAAKALGVAYDGAAQFLQREAARGRAGTDRRSWWLECPRRCAAKACGPALALERSSWRGVRRRRIEAKGRAVTFTLDVRQHDQNQAARRDPPSRARTYPTVSPRRSLCHAYASSIVKIASHSKPTSNAWGKAWA
jgi:hypothetical protein